MPKLSRSLGLTDMIFLGLGLLVGSGIYLFPVKMASYAGTYSLIAWVAGGFYQVVTGLCFAENAARMPKVGGLYAYAHDVLGNIPGFMTGWTFWLQYTITIATETRAISLYTEYFLPGASAATLRWALAIGSALVLTFINFLGVKSGGRTQDVLTVGKVAPLFIFVVIGIFFFSTKNYYPVLPQNTQALPAVASATVLGLWAYLGAEIITVPDEEVKEPKRTVPRALIISNLVTAGLYCAVAAVALAVARWDQYQSSQTPLAGILQSHIGPAGGYLLAVGGLIAIVGSLSAVTLGTARISYAMARDGLLPKPLEKLHPKHKTPYVGMVVQLALAFTLIFFIQDLASLATLAVLFTITPYLLSTVATVQMLRRSGWKAKVVRTRWIPVLSILMSIAIIPYFPPGILLVGGVLIVSGFAVYFLNQKFCGRKRETHSKKKE